MVYWLYDQDHKTIDIDTLLQEYEDDILPPPTCWEKIKAIFGCN
jgi:hypothetical protein